MVQISTFVFFDIETTGLPWEERNQTKITEVSLLAVHRKDIMKTPFGSVPQTSQLSFLLNPKRPINPIVTNLTGLSNELLKKSPVFKDKFQTIYKYLDDLPKPVCLVAHNGNIFDFKILLAECGDINASLPKDLMCADSLVGFRVLLKGSNIDYRDLKPVCLKNELLTDDEDDNSQEWPDLNISEEEWNKMDELCSSLSDVSFESTGASHNSSQELESDDSVFENKRLNVIKNVFAKKSQNVDYNSLKLVDLYKRLMNKEVENAHRAVVDCVMLLECVVALKDEFLPWADKSCKLLTEIKPLDRNFKKSFK